MANIFKLVASTLFLAAALQFACAQPPATNCPASGFVCSGTNSSFYRTCDPYLALPDDESACYARCPPPLQCKADCASPCVSAAAICSCPGGGKTFYCSSTTSFVLCSGTTPTAPIATCSHPRTCHDDASQPCLDATTTPTTTPTTTTTTTPTTTPTTAPTTAPTTTPTTTPTTAPTTTPTTSTTPVNPAPTCTLEGIFPVAGDCSGFYGCFPRDDGTWWSETGHCPDEYSSAEEIFYDREAYDCSSDESVCL